MINFSKFRWQEKIFNYSEDKNLFLYFTLCLVGVWGSAQLIGTIFSLIYPDFDKKLLNEMQSEALTLAFFMNLIVAPFLETAILVYSMHLSKQTSCKRFYILISTVPICLLHLPGHWQLFFIVFLPFYFQAIAYISVRQKRSFKYSFLFLVGIHFCSNLITMVMNAAIF